MRAQRVLVLFASSLTDVRKSRRILRMQQTTVHEHVAAHSCTPYYSVEGVCAIDWHRWDRLERETGMVVIKKNNEK